jgi:hypothetical protein
VSFKLVLFASLSFFAKLRLETMQKVIGRGHHSHESAKVCAVSRLQRVATFFLLLFCEIEVQLG